MRSGLKVDAEPASDGQLGQTPYTSPLLSVQSPENKRTEEQVDARVAELVREVRKHVNGTDASL